MTYDAIGNMLTKGSTTYTWTQGRKLASVQNGKSIQYFYDHTGNRTRKVVDGVTTQFRYAGDLLVSERTGSEKNLWYRYDSAGNVISVTYDSVFYTYVRNVQNDVIAMLDSKGNEVVRYTYDSWGRVMSITGSMRDSLGERNPFRYRGYYYDTETGLYYLKNRYYDPEIRRFISTDSIDVLEVQNDLYDKNLYAYCDNNPVMRHDLTGNIWGFVLSLGIGALSGAIISAVTSVVMQKIFTGEVDGRTVLIDMGAGALSGALAVTKIEVVGQVVGNAAISMGSYAISEGENATVQGLIGSGVIGAAGGFVGGSGLNLDRQMGVKAYSDMRVQRCVSPRKVAMYASKSTAATSNIRVAAGRFAASVGVSSAMSNVKSFLGNAISSCFNWLKRRFK